MFGDAFDSKAEITCRNTMIKVAERGLEVFPPNSRRKGKAFSLPKSKRKTMKSSFDEALKKKLLESAT